MWWALRSLPTPPPVAASKDNVLGASPYERLSEAPACSAVPITGRATLRAPAVVLTTGTFMRGLMHTGPRRVEGGRIGEAPAVGISQNLRELGFELGATQDGHAASVGCEFAGTSGACRFSPATTSRCRSVI